MTRLSVIVFLAAAGLACRDDYNGGSSSSSSSSTSSSTSTDEGSCEPAYGPCRLDEECCAGECVAQGDGATCGVPCLADDQCPDVDEGTAPPFCFNLESCVLRCNQGQECPPAMECAGAFCVWPWP